MKELKSLSEMRKRRNSEDSDGGADPKVKDLGRERRKQKRLELTDAELLRKLREAEANIRIVQKETDYTYEP